MNLTLKKDKIPLGSHGDGALVGSGLDLIQEDIAAPAKAGGGPEVVEAGAGVGELLEDQKILSPGNSKEQFKAWRNCTAICGKPFGVRFWDGLSQNCRATALGFRRSHFWDSPSQKWGVAVGKVELPHSPDIVG